MSAAAGERLTALAGLWAEAEQRLNEASTEGEVEELRTLYLGRKAGRLTAILKELPGLAPDERRQVGEAANKLKADIERKLDEAAQALAQRPKSAAADLTMPGRLTWRGAKHPATIVTDRITAIFAELGFTRYVGPEAETERNNFTALNFPADHPALDMHDTLYLGPGILLRTHTSPLQIRCMESYRPPIRVLMPGMCYRKDPFDASHAPMFAQIEGLAVDEGITFVDLKATLTHFARRLFGEDTKVRFRPSYFPFTEPSGEMDVGCGVCGGAGCPACKHTGWMEILGCGMVDPAVLENVGVDPERYTGWAFGMGPGRMAMNLFGIPDFRMLYEADMRLAAQFVDVT
jgi:phenylalanyl-tRNA synthetase alpha chain